MEEILQILRIAISDGFVWFPMVLGVGLLYTHLKIIDVGIDGVIIFSGIACAWLWNTTHSYGISLVGTIIVSVFSYSSISLLITRFKVNPVLAGLLFSIVIHAFSVILIGESIVLKDTGLFNNFLEFSWLPVIVSFIIALASFWFFRTNIGIGIRLIGNTPTANSRFHLHSLFWLGYCATGIIVGLGSFIYTQQQSVARAGGGFEFLVTSLCSFLVVDRLIEILVSFLQKSQIEETKRISFRTHIISTVVRSPITKAFIGAMLFQIVTLYLISKVPNPAYWKLIFGIVLLASVIRSTIKGNLVKHLRLYPEFTAGVYIGNITVGYDIGYEVSTIFRELTVHFKQGINYVWGPNGSGKSTLLSCIHGTIPLQQGFIAVNGKNTSLTPTHKHSTFFLAQNPFKTVASDLTVYENLIGSKKNSPIFGLSTIKSIVNEAKEQLKALNLNNTEKSSQNIWTHRAGELSGGQAQRLAVNMALISNSEVLLADEPSSGLDNENLANLIKILEEFASQKKTIILATHDNRLFNMPGKHYKIEDGKVILFKDNNSITSAHQPINSQI